jgi:enoyl-CoA hydratase
MSYQYILLEKNIAENKHIAMIKLNRPKVLNALSSHVMVEVTDALEKLEDDHDVRVIILTGDERAFAAGADISEMQNDGPMDQINKNRMRAWNKLTSFTKPIIAAVSGFALGGGCELAMSCDFIVAADNAQFGQPEVKIGTLPGAGGTQRLTKAIGKSKAMYYILTGEMISAKQAFEWGLIAKVVPTESLTQEAIEVAKKISALSPVAIKLAKESVNKSFEMTLKDGLDFERRNFYLSFSSRDQKEGMSAFVEKRSAHYIGE